MGYADDIIYHLTSAEDAHDINSDMEVNCNWIGKSKLKILHEGYVDF